jgi:hypothetical protein
MRPMLAVMISGWLLLGIWCAPVSADGGSLRLSGKKGGYQVTVFTAPTPFRAGAVDISALVQDASTGDPMTQMQVTVRMTKPGSPALEYPATTEAATNKLFRAAQFELPEPGRWEMQVQVEGLHGLTVFSAEVEAAEPLPRWQQMWPWIGWPLVVIALFGIQQVLVKRKGRSSTERGQDDRHELHSRGLEEVAAQGDRGSERPLRAASRAPGSFAR